MYTAVLGYNSSFWSNSMLYWVNLIDVVVALVIEFPKKDACPIFKIVDFVSIS